MKHGETRLDHCANSRQESGAVVGVAQWSGCPELGIDL
jgi:hypothetical protein